MSPLVRSLSGVLLVVAAACGGNVVVDHAGDGGAGGAPPTTSTDVTGSTTGPTGTSTGPSTTSTSTGGPSDCDGTGECGDSFSGCVACALEGKCAIPLSDCQGSETCVGMASCMDPCGFDQACIDDCAAQFPEGALLYDALVNCVLCEQCPIDCGNAPPAPDPIPGCG